MELIWRDPAVGSANKNNSSIFCPCNVYIYCAILFLLYKNNDIIIYQNTFIVASSPLLYIEANYWDYSSNCISCVCRSFPDSQVEGTKIPNTLLVPYTSLSSSSTSASLSQISASPPCSERFTEIGKNLSWNLVI